MERTHASFFSGVGGLDLGLERAGWRTVSFSEVDPYASAVLARHWPDVPNLGDILAEPDPPAATLWSGGFPCQDLSIAGKRRGLAGARSGLAFAFLDLVGRHHPPAVLVENVSGLLSSHRGRDLATLLGRMGDLGYGWAFRLLDAQHFDVPQRRSRLFIVAISLDVDPSGERAAEVLAVGTRCERHPPTGIEAGEGSPARAPASVDQDIVRQSVSAKWVKGSGGPAGDEHHNLVVSGPPDDAGGQARRREGPAPVRGSVADPRDGQRPDAVRGPTGPTPDPGRDGTPDGMARRVDDRPGVAWVKAHRAADEYDSETWGDGDVSPTVTPFDVGDVRSTTLVPGDQVGPDDDLLPIGLDSHRYRCCGNGVVSSVAEWIGHRLAEALP